MSNQLSICVFYCSTPLAKSLKQRLASDRYCVNYFNTDAEFLQFVEDKKQQIDCFILQDEPEVLQITHQLREKAILLPAVIMQVSEVNLPANGEFKANAIALKSNDRHSSDSFAASIEVSNTYFYHIAEVKATLNQLEQLGEQIHQALTEFLNLSANGDLLKMNRSLTKDHSTTTELATETFLMLQQRRLAEKLRERLGYLGVYYKRNPKRFLRHLTSEEKQEFLSNLKADYREIILVYFSDEKTLNQKIDNFVNTVFFADVPVTTIVEIHMELMDDFAKQLKLEGRSEEVLLDYRLTLIDIIAHLCEMYRRSIPRES